MTVVARTNITSPHSFSQGFSILGIQHPIFKSGCSKSKKFVFSLEMIETVVAWLHPGSSDPKPMGITVLFTAFILHGDSRMLSITLNPKLSARRILAFLNCNRCSSSWDPGNGKHLLPYLPVITWHFGIAWICFRKAGQPKPASSSDLQIKVSGLR